MFSLDAIEDKMLKALEIGAGAGGDPLFAHIEADNLLVKLVKELSTDENREQVNRILELYDSVGKWYA